MRHRLLDIFLWLSVIGYTAWFGGTLYQTLAIDPAWSASPPDSLRNFLQVTDFSRRVLNFFGPPFMVARTLPLLVALATAWNLLSHRKALLFATLCWVGIVIPMALLYIDPINDVIFTHAAEAVHRTSCGRKKSRLTETTSYRFSTAVERVKKTSQR
ncbi:MAG: hypothetical protein ABI823_02955 [Bryobacteraceae bacterium]